MMKPFKNILIIIQRSNGDVFLSSPLIRALKENFINSNIDLLVNDDTLMIAKTLPFINNIYTYSYSWKKKSKFFRLKKEFELIKTIYKKYDLSINLTASDRSVLYSILSSKTSISAIESIQNKSWWKKIFLTYSYNFDIKKHIVLNNIASLDLLGIKLTKIEVLSNYDNNSKEQVLNKLRNLNIKNFIIFHPSAQYDYKIYPDELRNKLLKSLNDLNIPIIVTGAKSIIDLKIKETLPSYSNIYDFIGETNLDEYIALSDLSLAYIGMDTLNMHIAASQNKKVFAIFGPTILSTWAPWSNLLQKATTLNLPKQTYGNITIFQADMSCVACGKAGCDDKHGKSDCLYEINPEKIFDEVKDCLKI